MMQYSAEGRSDNALRRVVFIVHFDREFSEEDFQAIDAGSKRWRQELPRRSVHNAVLLQPRSNRVAFDEDKIVGLSYESLMKDGEVEYGLRFEEDRILFLSGRYTNWSRVWPTAEKHLTEAMSLFDDDIEISSFAVEYADLFRARGKYEEFDASQILRRDSKYVPEHVFERTENFHFHTGYFELGREPSPYRLLTRINADLRDNIEEDARDLSITLYHQILTLPSVRGGSDKLPDDILHRGLKNFEDLHKLDKSVLEDIINDEMCREIGLKK